MRSAAPLLLVSLVALLSRSTGAAEVELRTSYDGGFQLTDSGGRFELRLGGNLHFDGRAYQAEERGSPHSLDIRRARIELSGHVYRWLTFRLQAELSGAPYLRNAWVDGSPGPWLHVRVGQLKVPFGSAWLTTDNNLPFIERASSTPVYPFLDRGVLLWGSFGDDVLVYDFGAFTGAGVDADAGKGDVDDSKDLVGRLFLQPLRHAGLAAVEGLFLAAGTTWGRMSAPTARFETGGLASANYETALWRWRTEQLLGTDGRVTDSVGATIDSRLRLGAELHYLVERFALSAEYAEVRYYGIELHHDLVRGSSRIAREELGDVSGNVRTLSIFAACYLTGERQQLTHWGWRAAAPRAAVGAGGPGAFELLARYSRTWSDERLFDGIAVDGFVGADPRLPADYAGPTPGSGNGVGLAVLDGAHDVHEVTLGLSWTLNGAVRLQLNDVFLWAPDADRDGDGRSDNLLISGANSSRSDPTRRNTGTGWENAVLGRVIVKI